ncbi:MAG: hypothetical protein ACRD9R_03905 [Pyrinomonadaceae bacterium]
MSICPCCGAKLTGDLRTESCRACGAFAIGPPLAQPDFMLPSYGRALAVGALGALLVVVFLSSTGAAFFEKQPLAFGFWDFVVAAETAAWRLKWMAWPLSLAALWAGWRALRTVERDPARFAGLGMARAGLASSGLVAVGIAALVAVTIPTRLHQRRLAAQAAKNAVGHEVNGVLLEYQRRHGSYPSEPKDLLKLPDRDGSVARVLTLIDPRGYEPESAIASLPKATAKAPGRRASVVKTNASRPDSIAAATTPEGLAFTNYRLILPGADKLLGTEDDITIRDGIIVPNAPAAKTKVSAASTNGNRRTP